MTKLVKVCEKCGGWGKHKLNIWDNDNLEIINCLDCKGSGQIEQVAKTFESELHDLITKYDLCHTTLTPEHIKQQIMQDNIDTHNETVKAKHNLTEKDQAIDMRNIWTDLGLENLINDVSKKLAQGLEEGTRTEPKVQPISPAYEAGYRGRGCYVVNGTDDEAEYFQGRKDRLREKGDE